MSGRQFMLALALAAIAVPAQAATIQIVMQDLVFAPTEVSAKVGDTHKRPLVRYTTRGGLDRVRKPIGGPRKERRGGLSFRLALCRAA